MDYRELQLKSVEFRREILNIIKHANAGHTGGSLSCIDILNVLYNRVLNISPENKADPNRDRYIHSKGHSVEAQLKRKIIESTDYLYALVDSSKFGVEDMTSFARREKIMTLFTDSGVTEEWKENFVQIGINLVICDI